MGDRMTADLVLAPLNMALHTRRPDSVIHHSDQGSQRANCLWQPLPGHGRSALDGNGWAMPTTTRCLTSFFASLECELINRRSWKSQVETRTALFVWIEGWYNPRRRHSALHYLSPINFERKHIDLENRRQEHGLPTASAGTSQTPSAAVDNPAPVQSSA